MKTFLKKQGKKAALRKTPMTQELRSLMAKTHRPKQIHSIKAYSMDQKDQNQQNKDQENEQERSTNPANEPTPIYLTGDSTLQTPEEDREDKSKDPRSNDTFEPSEDDLRETNADRLAGSDRAG